MTKKAQSKIQNYKRLGFIVMKSYDTIVIGAGASGLVASATLKGKTLLIEANDRVGKKILATGNGRCNLGNENTSGVYYSSPDFFDSVYGKNDTIVSDYFKSIGLLTKSDNAGRIYPYTFQASTVLDVLRGEVKCDTVLSQKVLAIKKIGTGYRVITNGDEYSSNYVIVATGGGENDFLDGLVEGTELSPMLCPIKTDTTHLKGLDGVRVHCGVSLYDGETPIYDEFGEVLFRTYGVSGVAVFNASAYVARSKVRNRRARWMISLDFLCDANVDEVYKIINERIIAGVEKEKLLVGIVANKLSECIMRRSTEIEASALIKLMRDYRINVVGLMGDTAQVTSGGVSLDSVGYDFECKKHKGLFITGEALDMDGLCGGYNLHWAFMSGLVASKNISLRI